MNLQHPVFRMYMSKGLLGLRSPGELGQSCTPDCGHLRDRNSDRVRQLAGMNGRHHRHLNNVNLVSQAK